MTKDDQLDRRTDLDGFYISPATAKRFIDLFSPPGRQDWTLALENYIDQEAKRLGIPFDEACERRNKWVRFFGVQPLFTVGELKQFNDCDNEEWVVEDEDAIKSMKRFREIISWWREGGRATQVVLEDAQQFRPTIEAWRVYNWGCSRTAREQSILAEQVELSHWYAVAVEAAIVKLRLLTAGEQEPDIRLRASCLRDALNSVGKLPRLITKGLYPHQEKPPGLEL